MRPPSNDLSDDGLQFQSTHPHGVRQIEDGKLAEDSQVSIHAPARGATSGRAQTATELAVSIHAPARGATGAKSFVFASSVFQSTHPHGVRPMYRRTLHKVVGFNPRTRTGCDLLRIDRPTRDHCFNPRTRTGCDRCWHLLETLLYPFQSTHPHGVRRLHSITTIASIKVSIHAPARGATAHTTQIS